MKNQKGITLIALVITIIVLLILAGITIAMLAGENGILSNATKAKATNELGTAKDMINLEANDALAAYFNTTYVGSSATAKYTNAAARTAVATAINGITLPTGVTFASKSLTGDDATYTFKITSGDYSVCGAVNGNGSVKWGEIDKTASAAAVTPETATNP